MAEAPAAAHGLPPSPGAEFAEFGEVETVPLSRMQRLTGEVLARNWTTIPHVTHQDEVDVTAAERARAIWNAESSVVKITPAALFVRALAEALRRRPRFNSSLSGDGKSVVMKNYFNIGVAVDTPSGLLVPVLRNVLEKSVRQIAQELAEIAEKARTKGLSMAEMSGSCMCLTSLGHIGGTGFTPIINAPDVAILGVTAIQLRPFPGDGGEIVWRKMAPLSLSYDHRVINGADAARFVRDIGRVLADPAGFE